MSEYLKCEDCDKEDKTVCETICPYNADINNIEIPVHLCPECYQDRADDI